MNQTGTIKAAKLLSEARQHGAKLPGLPSDLVPANLGHAYDIQAASAGLRRMPTAAFKVGLTSATAQQTAGAQAPIVGRLAPSDIRPSGAVISLRTDHLRVVEAEVVFEIGVDLPVAEAPFPEARVRQSIRSASAAIEICDSRFLDSDNAPLESVVADNSNADLLVIGHRLALWDASGLRNLTVTLSRTGAPSVHGSTSAVLGHPLRSVTWLANWLAEHGQGLSQGQLVATGSCTGMTVAGANETVTAEFGDGACVIVTFATSEQADEVCE